MSAYSIILNVTGKNNASSILKNAAKEIKSLGTEGSKVGGNISKGMAPAQKSVEKVGTTASSTGKKLGTMGTEGAKAGSNITKSMSGASNAMGGMGDILTTLAGGYGVLTLAQAAWTGSTQAQFNKAYLATKVGTKAADEYVKSIQTIVAEVPGDDTFMNQILTGAVAKQTNISNTELKALGNGVADYLAVSKSMGKSNIETQNDLNEYIKTGNTTQLERDSILKNQMGTLEGQGTVSERILALNTALKAEGYAGLSQLDIASIKAEELKGKFQLTATEMGTKILPYAERFLDFMLDLDKATKGQSTMWLLIAGGVVAVGVAMAPLIWSMKQVSGGVSGILGGFKSIGSKIKDFILPTKKKVKIECDRDKDCNCSGGGKGGVVGGSKGTKGGLPGKISAIDGAMTAGGLAGLGLTVAATVLGLVVGGVSNWLQDTGFTKPTGGVSQIFPMIAQTLVSLIYKADIPTALKDGFMRLLPDKSYIISALQIPSIVEFIKSKIPSMEQILALIVSTITPTTPNTPDTPTTPSFKWPKLTLPKWPTLPKFKWPGVKLPKWPTLPKFKWPGMPKFRWPGLPRFKWPGLPKFKWPGIPRFNWPKIRLPRFPSIPQLRWPTAGQLLNALTGKGPKGPGNARGPGLSSRIINTARGPVDTLKDAMSGFKYDDYAGHQKSIAQVLTTGSGNCVDLTLTQMALGSAMGLNVGMKSTTWNGGNHVLGTIGSSPMDVANHALTGSWSSPPRGPGDNNSNGDTYIINGDVYGWDDFVRKVETANDQIIGHNLTL